MILFFRLYIHGIYIHSERECVNTPLVYTQRLLLVGKTHKNLHPIWWGLTMRFYRNVNLTGAPAVDLGAISFLS